MGASRVLTPRASLRGTHVACQVVDFPEDYEKQQAGAGDRGFPTNAPCRFAWCPQLEKDPNGEYPKGFQKIAFLGFMLFCMGALAQAWGYLCDYGAILIGPNGYGTSDVELWSLWSRLGNPGTPAPLSLLSCRFGWVWCATVGRKQSDWWPPFQTKPTFPLVFAVSFSADEN